MSSQLATEVKMFERAAIDFPRNATIWETLGLLKQLAGDEVGAFEALYKSYEVDPLKAPAKLLFNLANNMKAVGRDNDAVEVHPGRFVLVLCCVMIDSTQFYFKAISAEPRSVVYFVLSAIRSRSLFLYTVVRTG